MLSFYNLAGNAVSSLKGRPAADYSYCDTPWFRGQFVRPLSEGRYALRMQLPDIHCAACVWLLEKLPEMVEGVRGARIHYLRKRLDVTVDEKTPVSTVVRVIADLGYTPDFASEKAATKKHSDYDKSLLKKMAVAAFGFGNAMLLSLPEYLSQQVEKNFAQVFVALNAGIAVFVLFYAAGDFFRNAWRALKKKRLVIDAPIALGITAMFVRSAADVLTGLSPGYFDTFAGLIFFLLLGRYVQSRSHAWLNFERDNVLFLPLAVCVIEESQERVAPVHELVRGSRMRLRSGEINPTRARLLSSEAVADYSFITGEAQPITLVHGDILETGAKVLGASIELEVLDTVDPARLNRLWENSEAESDGRDHRSGFAERVIPWFTFSVLAISFAALFYWLPHDGARAWNAFSAVLIITCPCALAMARPFSLFTTQSVLARHGLFTKSSATVEKFFSLKHIVFDKTGTLTNPTRFDVLWHKAEESREDDLQNLALLARESSHPLSRAVAEFSRIGVRRRVDDFIEKAGKGVRAQIQDAQYLLGSWEWLRENGVVFERLENTGGDTLVFAARDKSYLGFFSIKSAVRPGLESALRELEKDYALTLLSGDSAREEARFAAIFSKKSALHFGATPGAKKEIVEALKASGGVMMVGDGLNDAEALKAATLGVAITEQHSQFTPASDAILSAASMSNMPQLIAQAAQAKRTITATYALSFAYNLLGVSVAVTGMLTPLFCAILMPLSSLSVIALSFSSAFVGASLRRLR